MYCEPLVADCPDHLVWLNDGILNQQVVHLLKNALQADVLMPINTLLRHQLCCTVCCADAADGAAEVGWPSQIQGPPRCTSEDPG